MIDSGTRLSKEEQREVLRRRKAFSSAEGIKTLAEIVVSAGVFEKLDPSDSEAVAVRNFAIDLMDSMCMVQEGSLEALLKNMLSAPLPEVAEEEEGEENPRIGF